MIARLLSRYDLIGKMAVSKTVYVGSNPAICVAGGFIRGDALLSAVGISLRV